MDKQNRSLFAAKVTVPGWGDEINDGGGRLFHEVIQGPRLRKSLVSSTGIFPRLCVNSDQKGEGAPRRMREAL